MLNALALVSGQPAPRFRVPLALAFAAACAETFVARLAGREPKIPIDGVRIARHSMFVDCSKAVRDLGFAPSPVAAALGRAVRWYEDNGYVAESHAERLERAHAA
jgi:dihydroflavonol-4-reductase